MQAIAGMAFIALLACAWTIGGRLLLLARRTRRLPEAALGGMLVGLMGIGYPLAVCSQAEAHIGVQAAKLCLHLGNLFINLGFLLVFVFNWQVFRPNSGWAKATTLLAAAVLILHFGSIIWVVGDLESLATSIEVTRHYALLTLGTSVVGYLWSAVESIRYRSMLERRVAIGLADPIVSNRFLLWSLMGAVTAIGSVANCYFLIAHIDVIRDPMAQAVVTATGIFQAALLYLTFVPPNFYTKWLSGDAVRTQ